MLKKIVLPLLLIFTSTSLFGFQPKKSNHFAKNDYLSLYTKKVTPKEVRFNLILNDRQEFNYSYTIQVRRFNYFDRFNYPQRGAYETIAELTRIFIHDSPNTTTLVELDPNTAYEIRVSLRVVVNENNIIPPTIEDSIASIYLKTPTLALEEKLAINFTENVHDNIILEDNNESNYYSLRQRQYLETDNFPMEISDAILDSPPPCHRNNNNNNNNNNNAKRQRSLQIKEKPSVDKIKHISYKVNNEIIQTFNENDIEFLKELPLHIVFDIKKTGTYLIEKQINYKNGSIDFIKNTITITDKPVTLYSDTNEKGSKSDLVLGKTSLVPNNNTASSIRVFPNYEAILYTEQDFKGTTKSYRNTTDNKCNSLADGFNQGKEDITGVLNNTTSSVWVRKIPNAVNFYSEKDYQSGATLPYNFRSGKYNAIQMIEKGHSTIKSVRIPPQWRIKIHQNNTATEWLYGDQNLTKAYHFNNSSSYVQIEFNPIYNK